MLWELLATDIERIEGICAVSAVFEEVFFRFGLFLHRFVLAEAVATALHAGGLDGEDEVIVVLSVEVRHEALLAGETLVDEEVFFVVAHRVAEVHVLHLPAVAFELVDDYPVEVLVVDGIVGAEGGGIVVVDDAVRGVRGVVGAEVGDERRDFALELDVERFEDVQAVAPRLTADNPVDVGVVVHADREGLHRVDVRIRAAVERGVERREVREGADGIPLLLCLLYYYCCPVKLKERAEFQARNPALSFAGSKSFTGQQYMENLDRYIAFVKVSVQKHKPLCVKVFCGFLSYILA